VIDTLLQRAEALGAAVLVATHDPTVAQRFQLRWSLEDRTLIRGVVLRSG
jgi:ABC-type lipoprotein export system ATPase subunit